MQKIGTTIAFTHNTLKLHTIMKTLKTYELNEVLKNKEITLI
jgi:hypothetical protein